MSGDGYNVGLHQEVYSERNITTETDGNMQSGPPVPIIIATSDENLPNRTQQTRQTTGKDAHELPPVS